MKRIVAVIHDISRFCGGTKGLILCLIVSLLVLCDDLHVPGCLCEGWLVVSHIALKLVANEYMYSLSEITGAHENELIIFKDYFHACLFTGAVVWFSFLQLQILLEWTLNQNSAANCCPHVV